MPGGPASPIGPASGGIWKSTDFGRTLDVATTEPGIQFYTGNNLDLAGNGFGRRTAFCLETQHFPDSPNHPQFPSTILRPGQIFESTTVFTFGVTP